MALIPLINKSVHYPLIEDKISSLNQQNQQRTRNMQDEKEVHRLSSDSHEYNKLIYVIVLFYENFFC